MKKFMLMVIVFSLALFAKSGPHSQDRIETDPSNIQLESLVKVGLDVPIASTGEPWTSGGPIGGYIKRLAIAPSDSNVMYAATFRGVYRTSDGGATWTWVGDIFQYGTYRPLILDLQIAPDNPELVYAGTTYGIYISQNGGRDWTNTWPGVIWVYSIAVDPINPSNILIGTGTNEIVGIFKSTDGGMTWQEKLHGVSWGNSVATILFDTNDAQTVYAGTTFGGGLYKSTDGGETWIPLVVSSVDAVYALAMTPSGFSPATIYALAGYVGNDIYASTDQGATWDALLKPDPAGVDYLNNPLLVVDPGNAKQFYTSGPDSLYKYDSDTEQWTEIASGEFSSRPTSMVIDPQNGDLFVGDFNRGIFQSDDGGSQWVFSNLINTYINDLAVGPNNSQTAYAAVDGTGFSLTKTNNTGDTWDYLVNSESYLSAVAIDPQNPTTIYAAKDLLDMEDVNVAFIYKSVNSGQDWEKIPYMRCVVPPCEIGITKILVSATNSNNILVGGTGDNGLLARTTDGGINWDEIETNTTTTALAADPNNPDIVYGGGAALNLNFLFRYTDVWGNWTYTTIFGPVGMGTVRDIAVDQGSHVWCAASDGLRRWEEGADKTHFTNIPTDDIMAVTIDRSVSPNAVYIGTHGLGVYVSKDDGASWTAMNDGLGSLFVTTLQVSASQPKVLYAGTENRGVWSMMIENGYGNFIYLPLALKE